MDSVNNLLLQVVENQKRDGERLARMEEITLDMRTDLVEVRDAQRTCPGRIAEMQRQSRRAAWTVAGKILAWFVGICATVAGAIQAVASIFGG